MSKEQKPHQRRFSLEDDFMNYNTDDLLFGIMYHLSTYHPQDRKLYLSKKTLAENKNIIYKLCDLNSQKMKRHLDKLIKNNLIAEEDMYIANGKVPVPVYIFPFEYKEKYQLIDNEMLWYIASTGNHNCIRIYVLLLNYFLWKKEKNDFYTFTNTDLLRDIGYSADNKMASSMISNILERFQREGIIEYENYYGEVATNSGKVVPTPKKRLLFVAKTKKDLKPIE